MKNNWKKYLYRTGITLIVLSTVLWILLVVIPFLPLTNHQKALGISLSLLVAEIFFWIGAILVGKEVAGKMRRFFLPRYWKDKFTKKREKSSEH
ncbi:transporter suffix domain-containing protein [Mangrovibacillus cuniculi]|uniref:Transporter suffix domain-containing protein n=1 Tax=Mangrovibacillus cuniculi TaxID=2593652 RepID=A0A7S8C8Y2_9BACI|nr:transporter suffix domain-containing protein [Mangrovibacillus cuniculi]QPC45595.1 transporter suffix domain-containing protein [Mangrovibacillus cuniculi]